jgi:hypothetical protein
MKTARHVRFRRFALACGALAAVALGAAEPVAPRRTALVMLGGKDTWHLRPEQVDAFAGLLTGHCELAATFSDRAADFTFEHIRRHDLIVLYSALQPTAANRTPTKAALEEILRAVEAGTALLALHGGIFSPTMDGSPELARRVGAIYVGPHYPYQRIPVKIAAAHPITAGVADFTVLDEPYRLELTAPGAVVLATYDARRIAVGSAAAPNTPPARREQILASHTWAEQNPRAPLLYTHTLGRGRIVAHALGHDEAALRHPALRTLVAQSVRWLLAPPEK